MSNTLGPFSTAKGSDPGAYKSSSASFVTADEHNRIVSSLSKQLDIARGIEQQIRVGLHHLAELGSLDIAGLRELDATYQRLRKS